MLVFSCVTPHTPLLMPTIGKESLPALAKTIAAMNELEKELYVTLPDTLIVISPHGEVIPDAVSINLNPLYVSDFEEFGDLVTKQEWKCDMGLIDHVREDFKKKGLPLTLNSAEKLDYGCAVPLSYLTRHMTDIRIVPIITSQLDAKTHFAIGKEIKDEIMRSPRRVAVIASADLSHRVGENSTHGISPKGVAFDEKVIDIIKKRNSIGILDVDEGWQNEARTCSTMVLTMMCGLMEDIQYDPVVMSYEKPFGVGYMVAKMSLW